jgi:hypothetical protein
MVVVLNLNSTNIVSGGVNAAYYTAIFTSNPLKLDGEWEVALNKYVLWYTTYNISAALGNNTIKYSTNGGSTWKTITLPNGNYQVSDINAQIQYSITANGDTAANIVLNAINYLYSTQFVLLNSYQVDLTVGGLHSILGFNAEIITSTKTSEQQANISGGFTNFLITVSGLINQSNSYNGTSTSSVLYSDTWAVYPGSQQLYTIPQMAFVPVTTKQIDNLTIKITDQNGNILDFGQAGNYSNNGSSLTLIFKRKGEVL